MARISWKDIHLRTAPAWLRGASGATWLRGMGGAKDELEQRMYDATMARFIEKMSPSLLAAKGVERLLPRSPVDTDDTYRARLQGAWEVWPWAGTPTGILNALWDAGYGRPVLLTAQGFSHQLDTNRVLVTERNEQQFLDFDGTGRWNAYILLFDGPAPWTDYTVPSDGSDEANEVIALLSRWAPAHAALVRVTVLVSGYIWGYPFSQTWGSVTWDEAALVNWTP